MTLPQSGQNGSALTPFEDFLQAMRETNPGAQACLVVLDGDVTPPLDVEGFIAGIRLDGGPWEQRGINEALSFGARALRCDPEPDAAPATGEQP